MVCLPEGAGKALGGGKRRLHQAGCCNHCRSGLENTESRIGRTEKRGTEKRDTEKWKTEKEIQENRPEADGILPWDWILYAAVLITGYFFWQFSAPLVRYGYVYVLALPAAVLELLLCTGVGEKRKRQAVRVLCIQGPGLSCSLAFKAVGLAGGMAASAGSLIM